MTKTLISCFDHSHSLIYSLQGYLNKVCLFAGKKDGSTMPMASPEKKSLKAAVKNHLNERSYSP